MILGEKQSPFLDLNFNGKKVNNSRGIKLLEIVIDNQLKFIWTSCPPYNTQIFDGRES